MRIKEKTYKDAYSDSRALVWERDGISPAGHPNGVSLVKQGTRKPNVVSGVECDARSCTSKRRVASVNGLWYNKSRRRYCVICEDMRLRLE